MTQFWMQSCLAESNWDVEAAYDALRCKGLAAAAKKASRHAADGLTGLAEVCRINTIRIALC
jgi:elongation factor Ts